MEKDFQKAKETKLKSIRFPLVKIGSAEEGKIPHCATINKPLEQVALIVGDISNFPYFFEGLEKVDMEGQQASWHFRSSGSDLKTVMMKFTEDRVDRTWKWQADDSAGFSYAVAIKLDKAQADRGTIVQMKVQYENKFAGALAVFEKIFGGKDADMTSKINLARLKAFCETGSVPTIEGQPSGRDEDSKELKH